MNDNVATTPAPPPPPSKPPARVMITVIADMQNGRVFVNGPLNNKALVLHMLADAINTVVDHDPRKVLPVEAMPS